MANDKAHLDRSKVQEDEAGAVCVQMSKTFQNVRSAGEGQRRRKQTNAETIHHHGTQR